VTRISSDQQQQIEDLLRSNELSCVAIGKLVGVSATHVTRMRRDMRLPQRCTENRAVPDDFAEQYEALRTIRSLIKHYVASGETIKRWITESGLDMPQPRFTHKTPIPEDWHERAGNMTRTDALHFWKVTPRILDRWVADTGIKLRRFRNPQSILGRMGRRPVQVVRQDQLNTIDRAAQFLRRFYGCVHRADLKIYESGRETWGSQRGLPRDGAGLYNLSGKIVPAEDLLVIAEKHGWEERI